jgi:DNA-binding MarR family transcriptional regulator
MSNPATPIPLDLSGHREAPPEEIGSLLEKVAREPEDRALSALTTLLRNRTLRLLRRGSREEILGESLMLNRFLATEAGERLRQVRAEAFGGWSALGELLSGAARSSDRASVPAILSGSRGREILELLAGERSPLLRSEIKRRLDFTSESHVSHLLRDLEEADLIVRYRPEGSKEVVVELGPVGREVVNQSVLPAWLVMLVEIMRAIAAGARYDDTEAMALNLYMAGAPSRLASERIAAALASLGMPLPALPEAATTASSPAPSPPSPAETTVSVEAQMAAEAPR